MHTAVVVPGWVQFAWRLGFRRGWVPDFFKRSGSQILRSVLLS